MYIFLYGLFLAFSSPFLMLLFLLFYHQKKKKKEWLS